MLMAKNVGGVFFRHSVHDSGVIIYMHNVVFQVLRGFKDGVRVETCMLLSLLGFNVHL